ncbi:hypothetical protein TNCV_3169451 [Trichonephila clavipes]|nr:hypothetical protein TNCV_3169451 [Trichonephila clavipes]
MPPDQWCQIEAQEIYRDKGLAFVLSSLHLDLNTMQMTVFVVYISPQSDHPFPGGGQNAFHLSFPSTKLSRGLSARRIFRRASITALVLYIHKLTFLHQDANTDLRHSNLRQ